MPHDKTKPLKAKAKARPGTKAKSSAKRSPVGKTVTLSLEQAIDHVRGLLAQGDLINAENLLGKVQQVLPEEPDAMHLSGALRDLQGRVAEALPLLERSIALKPNDAARWNDLGNVLLKLRRPDEAVTAYEKSVVLAGETQAAASAHNNLGRMHMIRDDYVSAEGSFRRATELWPEFGPAFYSLSEVLSKLGRTAEAANACGRAIVLMPQSAPREHVARALIHLGRIDDAIAHYEKWIAEEPDNPVLQHHLLALKQPDLAERASDAYVESVFDGFAASFDSKLAELEYHAPERVFEALREVYPTASASLDIADAGCGTGLCGPLVKPWSKRLCGFDLSGGMLKGAEVRNDYTDLHKAELVAFLKAHEAEFDVVISADTLCYFGQLNDAMHASAGALRAGGHVIFTVEALDDDSAPHRLLGSGRYAHSLSHIEAAAQGAALQILSHKRVALRTEGGHTVYGWLVTLHRP